MRSDGAKRLLSATTTAVIVLLAACGESTGPGDDSTAQGSFQATVSGDLSLSLSGLAVFGTQVEGGDTGFVIALMDGLLGQDNSDIVFIGRDNPTAPGTGTFPIEPGLCPTCTEDDFSGAYVHQETQVDVGTYLSESGSFTISAASADTLRGEFDFTATAFLLFGNVTAESVQLTGSFTAVAGQVPTVPSTTR